MFLMADVGGTKTRIAASRDLKVFGDPILIDTPKEYENGLASLVAHGKTLLGEEPLTAIAIGIAGMVSPDGRTPLSTPHLQWKGHPLADDLERELGGRAYIENDVALCGLGEAQFGAGRGASIVAYLTVSTGVNGVRIVDGVIDRSAYGFELGGMYLSYDRKETIEDLISGTAIERRTGKHPKELGMDWDGWSDLARIAAYGVYNTISHWSPEIFVLGGSMMNEIGISIPLIADELSRINVKYQTLPRLAHSELTDFGGIWGGMARLRQLS